jgi:hypothetical protein
MLISRPPQSVVIPYPAKRERNLLYMGVKSTKLSNLDCITAARNYDEDRYLGAVAKKGRESLETRGGNAGSFGLQTTNRFGTWSTTRPGR